MIGQTISHYRILEQLGEGGMGVVYRAEDTKLGRHVALKFLPEEFSTDRSAAERFQREARLSSALNHPHICTIYDIDEHEGRYFIAMELLEGQTLKQRIAGQPLPTDLVLELGMQIADALRAAHAKRIIHRDIKPANIFVSGSRAKVLDFGLAKLLPQASDATATLSLSEGEAAGTLPYMAPEQLRGEPVDERADIYALGGVLYEMATGRRAFREEMSTRLIDDILHQPPAPPSKLNPGLPAALEGMILKCLEKDPENRYQSVKEVLVDLRRLAGSAIAVPEGRERPGGRRWVRRFVLPGLVLAAAILALLAGLDVAGIRERLLGRATPMKIESLAVLPLENLSGDPQQEYFADGMTEELIAELSKIRSLKVISRTSAMQYKGVKKPLPQIARELGVEGAIEGSVLREGEQVRITVQLIHGPTDKHLWAESYQREMHGVLALQGEVARAIAAEVRSQLTPNEQSRLSGFRQVDPPAYDAYLKGRYYWNQRGTTALKKALEAFQQAIEIDPTYAAAYAGLADTYNLLASSGDISRKESLEMARAAVKRALELDENLAEGHTALAGVLQSANDWNFNAAEAEFRRAIELNPNYATAHFWHAENLLVLNRADEAVAEYRRAEELDPLSPLVSTYVGFSLEKARRYDEAIAALHKTITLFPGFAFGHWALAMAFRQKGMYPEAIAAFKKAIELSPDRGDFVATLAHAYAVSGNKKEATKIVHELEASHAPAFALALVYLGLGDKDRALALLGQAYAERFPILPEALQDPLFDGIRPDPRFQDLQRRAQAGNLAQSPQ